MIYAVCLCIWALIKNFCIVAIMFYLIQTGQVIQIIINSQNMTDKLQPVYPKASTSINLKIDGIFAFPEQWKTTDEANPGMFTYVVKFCNMEILAGKIYPKELTEKQLREQEEAKKKGGKKQAKKEENPAELQRLKQQQQKEEAQEKRRQEQWSKMTEQQRFHHASQDKYKSAMLRFDGGNSVEKVFGESLFVTFEEHVVKDGGEWIYVFKIPTANQQDLQKLKKSKPKTLNLADLNPICMRGWLDLSALRSSEVSEVPLRCKLKQVDATEQTPKPNLQKTYIKVSLKLSQPLLQKQDQYTSDKIIKDPPQPKPTPADIKCVQQMKDQLRLAIESLAMQYSNMFWRDLNATEEQKNSQILISNKKNQHQRRKQQFLYDFNVSGKYKVLKQRLKKVIVHLCEHKFSDRMQGAKSFTGITSSVRDQFYSEIYNFLVTSYSDTMSEMVEEKKQKLKEVYVLNQENQNVLTEQHLQGYRKQSQEERFARIVYQYNLVGNYGYGQEMYKNAIAKDPNNINLKYQYSMFCLKNALNPVAEVLGWGYIEQYLENNKNSKNAKIQYVLLMIGTEESRNLKKTWIILRELIAEDPQNSKFLLFASLVTELLGKNQCADKLKFKAQRNQLRKQGKLNEQGKHNSEPIASEIPSLQSAATYNLTLKPQQKDQLWAEVMEDFSQLGIYNIVEKIKNKLQVKNNPKIEKQNVKVLYYQHQYKECKDKALQIYGHSRDFQLLEIIINCCQKLNEPEQKLKYLNTALKEGPKEKKSYALLNLGYYYLNAKKWGNCKACITKYLDGNTQAGGLSWQFLGISELMSNNYQTAIECFRHSNLCDPYNKELWVWMAQAYCLLGNFVMVNQCLNNFMGEADGKITGTKLAELKAALVEKKAENFYQSSIKEKLLQRLEVY